MRVTGQPSLLQLVRVELAAMDKALRLPVSSEGIFTFDDAVRLGLYHTQSSDEQLDGPPDRAEY